MFTSTLVLLVLGMNTSFAGQPHALYLHEGFNGSGLPAGWTQFRLSGTQAAWSVVGIGTNPPIPPFAGNGQAQFNSFEASVGEQARLVSPAINLASSTDPFLSFFMYHEDEYISSFDSVYVEASTADSVTGPWTTLMGLRRPRLTNGWSNEIVSLFSYVGTSRLFLSLRGASKYGNNIYVDEFRVADSSFHDIGVAALLPENVSFLEPAIPQEALMTESRNPHEREKRVAAPELLSPVATVRSSSQLPIRAVARNVGTFDESSYSIAWQVDGQLQSPVPGNFIAARSGLDTVTLNWASPSPGVHTITAWTVLPSDLNRLNDTSRVTVQVLEAGTYFYETFNGGSFPPAGWLTINRDGGVLPPWFRGADTSAFVPFEGSGFAANNFQRAFGTYLDDYLITPPLAGVGQTGMVDSLIFRIRSQFNQPPAVNFPDSLMILVSMTGTDTSHFSILLDYFAVPKAGWTRKAYSISNRVPANSTVRIAFRYLLYDVQPASGSGDFIGLDAVQMIRVVPASVENGSTLPHTFVLEQNYPNPFNPSTIIRYFLPEPSTVSFRIHNVLGQVVTTSAKGLLTSGHHTYEWNGTNLRGNMMPSGVYFYTVETRPVEGRNALSQTKKMILAR